MNKYAMYAIIAVAITLFLIYRKKIFREMKPTIDDLKNKIMAGEGMTKGEPAAVGTFIKGTEGERISNMLKDAAIKYDVRDLEGATRDWNRVQNSFDRTLMDTLNLTSRPATVEDLYLQKTYGMVEGPNKSVIDFGRIVRNQVVINDLWGHPCNCNCGCQNGFKGVALTRFSDN